MANRDWAARIHAAVRRRPRTVAELQRMLGPNARGPYGCLALGPVIGSLQFNATLAALFEAGAVRWIWGKRARRVAPRDARC